MMRMRLVGASASWAARVALAAVIAGCQPVGPASTAALPGPGGASAPAAAATAAAGATHAHNAMSATSVTSAATPAAPNAAAPAQAATDARHELGRKVWNFRCYFCHGYSGDARTLAATYLQPPPRDFTRTAPGTLPMATMVEVITNGKPGTAMKGFAGILSAEEVTAVAAFVDREFIRERAQNTRYHTVENGWPDHDRHRDAFPFARGEIALDTPAERLDEAQLRGRQLFMRTCITCHDHARVETPGTVWETRALSYPRDAYCTSCHEHPDGSGARLSNAPPPAGHPPVRNTQAGALPGDRSGPPERVANTYRVHDTPPKLENATPLERRGEALYQRDCAFCHAADGTAKSWSGRFLEPHPRDLTDPAVMSTMTRERLVQAIENGIEGTSMPAWKSVLERADIDALVAYIHRAFHPIRGV
jgi:cytochrome c oxidase cbb3-type subunit 3